MLTATPMVRLNRALLFLQKIIKIAILYYAKRKGPILGT